MSDFSHYHKTDFFHVGDLFSSPALTEVKMKPRRDMLFAAVLLVLATCNAAAAVAKKKFRGRWVVDASYPLYDSSRCPFVRKEFDTAYLKYRWQPNPPCSLPRFDGLKLLRRTSQSRCSACSTITVRFEDYSVTLVYYLSHYLVDIVNEKAGRVLKLDAVDKGHKWRGADVLVFGSWRWWASRTSWDYLQDGNTIMPDMDRTQAFTKGLQTWARWVDANLGQTSTKVFFQGFSPSHRYGEEWGAPAGKTCMGETQPLNNTAAYHGQVNPQDAVLRRVLAGMAKPVYLLYITFMSQLRKDGHTTKYNSGSNDADCTHWCVAGVPDTWNIILYASVTGHRLH